MGSEITNRPCPWGGTVAKRVLTLADLDKVSAIVERLTQASSHLQGWSRGA